MATSRVKYRCPVVRVVSFHEHVTSIHFTANSDHDDAVQRCVAHAKRMARLASNNTPHRWIIYGVVDREGYIGYRSDLDPEIADLMQDLHAGDMSNYGQYRGRS